MSYTLLDNPGETHAIRAPRSGLYRGAGKRILDIVLVVLIAPIVVPVLAAALLLTFLEGGNGIYGQLRVGRNGKTFKCWKIRTMVSDADAKLKRMIESDAKVAAEWQANQKLEQDPRITPLGRLLRKTSIDELPQLLNVLAGDMSLIGPRPFTPNQKDLYDAEAGIGAYYQLRPGISGLWQVACRNNGDFSTRVTYDEVYGKQLSFFGDIKIAFLTILAVLSATGK